MAYQPLLDIWNHWTVASSSLGLISSVYRIGYLMSVLEEQKWYFLTQSWEDKGVPTFSKGICPKMNVIARLEYELAYYDSAVHRFNHYTTRTPFSK